MKVFIKQPYLKGAYTNIPNTREAMEKIVGGNIEVVPLFKGCAIVCNEEGLISSLPFNLKVGGHYFFGTVIFVGVSGDSFCDIPDNFSYLTNDVGLCV